MADSTERDTEVQFLAILTASLIALIPGLVIHSFILGINVNDWWTGRSVTAVDQILTYLGITRMCSQCANTLDVCLALHFIRTVDPDVSLVVIDAVYSFFTFASIWLTTLLSIVFFLKIPNHQTRLFKYLRELIVQRTVYFTAASVLLSAFNCLMPLSMTITQVTKGGRHNTTINLSSNCSKINNLYNLSIGASIPLIFYYISSIFLFTSLYCHTTRMKMSSNVTINLETYYSVMRFVSLTFIYNFIYSISHFVCIFYYYYFCVSLPWLFILVGFLPVLHSSYLIYRTAKLRNQMSKVLQNVIDFLFQNKDAKTTKNIAATK